MIESARRNRIHRFMQIDPPSRNFSPSRGGRGRAATRGRRRQSRRRHRTSRGFKARADRSRRDIWRTRSERLRPRSGQSRNRRARSLYHRQAHRFRNPVGFHPDRVNPIGTPTGNRPQPHRRLEGGYSAGYGESKTRSHWVIRATKAAGIPHAATLFATLPNSSPMTSRHGSSPSGRPSR